jgi:hypothetical protein
MTVQKREKSLQTILVAVLALPLTLYSTRAQEDFWHGNAEDEYHDSGTFFISCSEGQKASLDVETHSGVFSIVMYPHHYYDWFNYIEFQPRTRAEPWEVITVEHYETAPFNLIDWAGGPGHPGDIKGHMFSFGSQLFSLDDYSRTYGFQFDVFATFAYDGTNGFSMSGDWEYNAVVIDENGVPPQVPESTSTLTLGGIAFLGLIVLKRCQRAGFSRASTKQQTYGR